jgi:hypothetical protein
LKDDAALEAELKSNLSNRMWRLRNLYWITDKSGKKVKFAPNDAQVQLLESLWYLNIILKARQRGFTTLLCLLYLDACLFNSNVRAGIVADTLDNVTVIFRDKIRFAYDNLPPSLRDAIETEQDQAKELLFGNNSSIRVGTSMRSGTLQYLHISEFGKICRHHPDKAKEVITGSLASSFVLNPRPKGAAAISMKWLRRPKQISRPARYSTPWSTSCISSHGGMQTSMS